MQRPSNRRSGIRAFTGMAPCAKSDDRLTEPIGCEYNLDVVYILLRMPGALDMKHAFRSYSLAVLALLALWLASAQPKAEVERATAVPSRIILSWAGDPARSQAVTWRTEILRPSAQAEIAKLTAGPDFEDSARIVHGTVASDDLGGGRTAGHYAVRFEGLDPATKYCYRVGDGRVWSEWNVFRTASSNNEPFRFIYLGDAQNDIKSLWSRVVRTAYAAAPDARFIVHAGDLVADGYDDRLWGEWADAMSFIGAMVPSLPVPGNHDLHRAPGSPNASKVFGAPPLWRRHFALPDNGPGIEELKSQCYYIDYQGVRFIALDVNAFANEDFERDARDGVRTKLTQWLDKTLQSNRNPWTVVVQHQTIYAIVKDRNYRDMRAALTPLYEKYKVDLVLQGHDHVYARTHKVAGGKVAAPSAAGVVYVISVSGPKMYDAHKLHRELMAKVIEKKQFYQIIEVSPERLHYDSFTLGGALADTFELRKTQGESLYVNGIPVD